MRHAKEHQPTVHHAILPPTNEHCLVLPVSVQLALLNLVGVFLVPLVVTLMKDVQPVLTKHTVVVVRLVTLSM